jgi:hypothetical protein
MSNQNSHSNVQTIAFLIIGIAAMAIIYLLLFGTSDADDSTASTTITNATPTVDTVIMSTSDPIDSDGGTYTAQADATTLTLVENTTKTIYIHGAGTDNNGCNDIDTESGWGAITYRTDTTGGEACASSPGADDNNCYSQTTLTNYAGCSGAGDLTINYEFDQAIQYFADATDTGSPNAGTNWSIAVQVQDEGTAISSTTTDTFEMNSLISLDVGATVSFGSLALGADSANTTATITNVGNRALDVDILGTSADSGNLVCDGSGSSNIAVGQIKMDEATITDWTGASNLALTASNQEQEVNIAARTDASTTANMNFMLRVPSTGLRGTCTNTITFTAKADT